MIKNRIIAALCALSMLSGIALSAAGLAPNELVSDTVELYEATSNEKVQNVV